MFVSWLLQDLILTGFVLLWAKGARLELGLRRPRFAGTWPWIALYLVWYAAEWVIFTYYPSEDGPDVLAELQELTLPGALVIMCVTGPLLEELAFRGLLFSALFSRWGIRVAAIVPSLLWGALHIGYEAWFVVSIAGSGVVLALIRWRSGSLWIPLVLHALGNLAVTLANQAELSALLVEPSADLLRDP